MIMFTWCINIKYQLLCNCALFLSYFYSGKMLAETTRKIGGRISMREERKWEKIFESQSRAHARFALEIESKSGSSKCIFANCVFLVQRTHSMRIFFGGCCEFQLFAHFRNINVAINIQMEHKKICYASINWTKSKIKKYGNLAFVSLAKQQTM